MAESFGALAGLLVVDLTQMLSGPFCTMLLADQGARVIKIEPPQGEPTREVGPFHPDDREKAYGGYYASVNRNKQSLCLDLKKAEAHEVLMRLIDRADVLVENFRAGVLDKLGFSWEVLHARNPKLVYAAIRGFGDPRTGESPIQDWPAYDVVAQAMGGLMSITGPDSQTPLKTGPGVGDIVPGTMAAFGILAAVMHARTTGEGQFVDVGMMDSIYALCERIAYTQSISGSTPRPEGNRHAVLVPFGTVPCKDGWVTIAADRPHFWTELCRLIGRPEMAADPRFATREARQTRQAELYNELIAFTRRYTKAQLARLFGGRIPFGPVLDAGDLAEHPHIKARDMSVELDHPGSSRKTKVAGVPIKMSKTPGRVARRAPRLGEDAEMILADIGCSADEIASLRKSGAVV